MKCIKMYLFLGLLIFSTISIVGQKRELDTYQFWVLVRASQDRARIYNRRNTYTAEWLVNAKLSNQRTYIYEYILPDRKRWVQTARRGDKEETTEQIEIGQEKFCRENNAKWEVKSCNQTYSGGGPKYISEKASVESIKIGKEKFEYYSLYRTYESDSELKFTHTEVWVDSLERIFKKLSTYGTVETKQISGRELDVYVYDPKDLKIEAPIK